jgi:hypothetical protein
MSRSEYKEQERTSKSHTQNEDEKEKKGNYMFSMEKMRNKFLFGDELEKSADKISTLFEVLSCSLYSDLDILVLGS